MTLVEVNRFLSVGKGFKRLLTDTPLTLAQIKISVIVNIILFCYFITVIRTLAANGVQQTISL